MVRQPDSSPFSHAMEHVIDEHYSLSLLKAGNDEAAAGTEKATAPKEDPPPPSFNHETLGRRIIEYDNELGQVLKRHDIPVGELKAAFSREQPGKLVNLVSSDLDCDRIDYLMRTSRHSGLPYGSVDAEYIIGQSCVDSSGRVCLSRKALRAADHLLISRYFDYTQVAFHKTVVAFEEVLKDIINELLKRGILDCSGTAVHEKIVNGEFASFDDHFMMEQLRNVDVNVDALEDDVLKTKIRSVLNRRPPKLVAACERIRTRGDLGDHRNLISQIKANVGQWAADLGVAKSLWHVWDRHLPMTKIGSLVPVSQIDAHGLDEETAQGVRILTADPGNENADSKLLVDFEHALAKQLSMSNLYMIRIYVHLVGAGDDVRKKRSEITARIRKDLPHFPFMDA